MYDQKMKTVGKNAVVAKLVTLNDLGPVENIMIATVLIVRAGDSERVRNVANLTCTDCIQWHKTMVLPCKAMNVGMLIPASHEL